MKKSLLNKLWLRVGMIVAIMTTALAGTAWAETTYKLEQVTSVEAGGLYVFEQGGYVMSNTVSSNALQTTSSYETTGLIGTETYVWTLEAATNGYYMKNVSLGASPYLRNDDGTKVVFNNNKTSQWVFNFQSDNSVLIQNKSYQDRFLGYTTTTSHAYKAYATSNIDSYPHAIKVYQLVEEGGGTPLADSDLALTNAPVALNFDLYNNEDPQTVNFTTSSTGAVTVSESEYVTTSVSGNTITVTPVKVTSSAQTITVSQAADDNYKAGSATFTISVTNSTPQYNVTYKANGGTGSDIVESYYQGENVLVVANTFTRTGYVFTKWNTSNDGSGTDYLPSATIENISANIDLYAQWEESDEIVYDFTEIEGFSNWNTTYQKHVVTYSDATVTFAAANRQPNSAISNQPVTKGGEVSLVLTDGSTMSSATFVCTQWGDKTQTITMWYSTDGGETYTSTGVTSTNFTITVNNLPEGTNAVKITFSSTNNQVGIAYAAITKVVDEREEARIAFSVETLEFTEGQEYTAPTFNNPNNVAVTFTSTNSNVASWDATNGLVLGGSTGTATITATFEGNDNYKPATVTLVVTVNKDFGFVDVVVGSGIYQKISSLSDLEAGKRYLVVYEYEEDGALMGKVMNGVDNSNMYAHVTTTNISNNRIDNNTLNATPIVLQNAEEDSWFLVENDRCLYNNTDGNYLESTENPSASGTTWTISYVEGFLKINNDYLSDRYIMYNSNQPRFSTYKNTQKNVTLYKELPDVAPETESVSVSALKYSTYASDNALDFTGSSIKAFYATIDEGGSTLIFHEITKVPAGTGVLLYSANGAVTEDVLVCTGETDAADGNLFVRGTGAAVSYTDTEFNYVLSKPQGDNLGFYKANNNTVAMNRAYIQVPVSGVKSFSINLDDDPTGISTVDNEQWTMDNVIYNLAGQRLQKMQKGINIVNGKKIAIK